MSIITVSVGLRKPALVEARICAIGFGSLGKLLLS